jgi:putative oxidoreductase
LIPVDAKKEDTMKPLLRYYSLAAEKISYLRSPFLLAVRLYWGWQFVQTGWGKMHHIEKITGFFMSLNIPFPAFNAYFVSGLEFFGGLLLIVGFVSRFTGLLLAFNMLGACIGQRIMKRWLQSSPILESSM